MSVVMHWLESHVGSMDKCVELANKLFWNLTIFQEPEGKWHVKDGEPLIFSADIRDAVDAFLYGMGLAYAGIPEDLLDYVAKALKDRGFGG